MTFKTYFYFDKVQERGYYQLKAEYWQEFDPLFSHFYPNELEDAQVSKCVLGILLRMALLLYFSSCLYNPRHRVSVLDSVVKLT